MSISIRKVKVKDSGAVHIEYVNSDGDKFMLECSDEPKSSFSNALKALTSHALAASELPADFASRTTVTGISVSETNDIMGVSIIAKIKLLSSNTPLNLHTPHKPFGSSSQNPENENQYLMPEEAQSAIIAFIETAEGYVNGERKITQTDAFESQEGE